MIPSFDGDVLPPFAGASAVGGPRSPYAATMETFVERFCTSPERADVIAGLLDYRQALRDAGCAGGFQWLDGSFVENCESVRGRPPSDIDVATFTHAPADERDRFALEHGGTLLNPSWTKETFRCDAYFTDLGGEPNVVALSSAYWIGVFSHQRDTFRWKGLVQVSFDESDDAAWRLLEQRVSQW